MRRYIKDLFTFPEALTLVLAGNVWQLGYSAGLPEVVADSCRGSRSLLPFQVLFVAILFVMYGFHAAHYDTMDIRRCLSG